MTVQPSQRVSKSQPCQICGGYPTMPRGRGERCAGFVSSDGWAHCTRENLAGGLAPTAADPPTYAHRLTGDCNCGQSHGGPATPIRASARSSAITYIGEPLRHLIRDASGAVVAVHARQRTRESDGSTSKRIWWEGPRGEKGLGGRDPRSLLYLAEKLAAYDPARPLVVCEGETAADAALGLGLQAVGTVSGAGTAKAPKTITRELAESLARRFHSIVLWPDRDDEGEAHVRAIRATLEHAHAARVRYLRWTEAPPHGDAADFAQNQGATGAAALALVDDEERRGPVASEYAYADGGIVWNNGEKRVVLLNAEPRIVEQSREDSGDDSTNGESAHPFASFTVAIPQADGTAHTFRIPAEEFDSCKWVAKYLGADAVIAPGRGMVDRLAAALHTLSAPVPETLTHQHVGWCRGDPLFVLGAGGAIGPDGIVAATVALEGPLARYTLGAPATGEELHAAVRSLLAAFAIASPRLAVPLMLHALGAPLEPAPAYTLHLSGTTGLGKTTLAILAARAFAPTLTSHDLTTYNSTGNAIAHLLAAARGLPYIVDDMAPDSDGDDARVRKEGSHVLRMVGNGAARDRLRRDATFNPGVRPRAAVISTGELDPETRSVIARTLILPVRSGDVLTESHDGARRTFAHTAAERADCDGRSGLHAAAVAAFVAWVAPRRIDLADFMREELSRLRGFVPATHARTSEMIGDLAARAQVILAYVVSTGAVSADEGRALWAEWWTALLDAAAEHGREMADTPAHIRIRRELQADLIAGRVHVATMGGAHPSNALDAIALGWREMGKDQWRAQGDCIGWTLDARSANDEPTEAPPVDDRNAAAPLYLETDGFEKRAKALGVSARSLLGELVEAGHLHTATEAGVRHYSVKVRGIAGRDRTRVHHFARGFLTDVEDDAPPPPAASLPTLRLPGDPPLGPDNARPAPALGDDSSRNQPPAPDANPAENSSTAGGEHTTDAAAIPDDFTADDRRVVADAIALLESEGITTREATARAIADVAADRERAAVGSDPARTEPARATSRWTGAREFAYLDGSELIRRGGDALAVEGDPLAAMRAAGIPRLVLHRDALAAWPAIAERMGELATADVAGVHVLIPERASGGAFADVPNARVGAAALAAYEALLAPAEFRYSAGHTGETLAFAEHQGPRGTKLPKAGDAPKLDGTSRADRQFDWYRDPSAEELVGARFLVAADKRACYLAAVSSLELGLDGLYELDAPIAFDARLPGFWRADLAPIAGLPPAMFGGKFHPTPAIELAVELATAGLCPEPKIERALVYRTHSRYLKPFYDVVRRARDEGCPALPEPVRSIVLRSVKATYTVELGGRIKSSTTRGYIGARPEWGTAIVAKAGANICRNAVDVWKASGRWPIGASVDQLYWLSESPDPTVALAGLKLGTTTGTWGHVASLPLDETTRAAIELARKRGRAGPLAALVRSRGTS